MPTYEYKCTECDERFEIEQSIKDDTLTVWPGDDHEHQLKKVFSPVGIAFKGQGFYKNDARKSGSKSSSSASTSSDSSSSSTSSSDSKGSTSSDSSGNSSSSSSSGSSASGSSTSTSSSSSD